MTTAYLIKNGKAVAMTKEDIFEELEKEIESLEKQLNILQGEYAKLDAAFEEKDKKLAILTGKQVKLSIKQETATIADARNPKNIAAMQKTIKGLTWLKERLIKQKTKYLKQNEYDWRVTGMTLNISALELRIENFKKQLEICKKVLK